MSGTVKHTSESHQAKESGQPESRRISLDTPDTCRQQVRRDLPPARAFNRPPMSPYGQHGYPPYLHQYAEKQTRPLASPVRTVITTSFSADERDMSQDSGKAKRPSVVVDSGRYEDEEHSGEDEEREDWDSGRHERSHGYFGQRREDIRPCHMQVPPVLHRTYSSPTYYYARDETLKRNFFHHSQSSETKSEIPKDFLPPKRQKIASLTDKDVVVTPRGSSDEQDKYGNGSKCDSSDNPFKYFGRSSSYPTPHYWIPHYHHAPSSMGYKRHKKHAIISPSARHEMEGTPGYWHPVPPPRWYGIHAPHVWLPGHAVHSPWSPQRPHARFGTPNIESSVLDSEKETPSDGPTQVGTELFEKKADQKDNMQGESLPDNYHDITVESQSKILGDHDENDARTLKLPNGDVIPLLALMQDRVSLSETLCVVRENIEVFTATQRDVDAPAPGRKHAVTVGQVGLRCIHCRHTTKSSDRVKRAVCYPSSIKRIYRTVIDMKLDHFSQCKYVPESLRKHLNELKAVHSRSTGTTMQYFIRAAKKMGMEDAASGVRLSRSSIAIDNPVTDETTKSTRASSSSPPSLQQSQQITTDIQRKDSTSSSSSSGVGSPQRANSISSEESFDGSAGQDRDLKFPDKFYEGLVPLSLPEDKASLSPLRCFLREQVCAFSATEEDIAVRAPTTFSICVGQVGIGCIHCVKQASKLRSNRAVCFPFSIGRIYQSVADIQRFHLGECKLMPPEVKEKFLLLQGASSKGSKGLATRQYWVTSARKIGLVDTPQGLRFGRDPLKPDSPKAFSLDILAQVAFSVTTQSKQLVLPEDKPNIAEFLYVVMEQLQPCRFTEADRNKRRLKDVGCIGVECKHCAGQVDGRKFFWSSVSAVESNFVSVHTHMLECRMIPDTLKQRLQELKKLRKEQTSALRTGSQKAFFARVWDRLHKDDFSRRQEEHEAGTHINNVESPLLPLSSRGSVPIEIELHKGEDDAACSGMVISACMETEKNEMDVSCDSSEGRDTEMVSV